MEEVQKIKETPEEQALKKARALLKAKQYSKAREILMNIDHPMAIQWIEQIDIVLSGRMEDVNGLQTISYDDSPGLSSVYVGDLIRPLDRPRISDLPAYGFGLMAFIALLGGALMGLLLFNAHSFIYVAVVSTWVAARIGAWLLQSAIRVGGVRSSRGAFWLGLLMGIVLYGTYSYLDYRDFVLQSTAGFTGDFAEAEAVVNTRLERLTGSDGFIGYKMLRLDESVVIVRSQIGPEPLVVDNPPERDLSVVIMVLEAVVAILTPARLASRTATQRRRRQPRLAVQPI